MIHKLSSREILRRLNSEGWYSVHQNGSHLKLRHPTRRGMVVVPHPRKDLPAGTLRSISKQAGWSD